MSKEVYIAAPFFNPDQTAIVEVIKSIVGKYMTYFSPKDESMFKQGDNPAAILELNCEAIDNCDMIIVVTDGKDVGTIWEAGYAYAMDRPILYVWLGWTPALKFNIMLAASGSVVHTYEELDRSVRFFKENKRFPHLATPGMLHE